MTDIRIIVPTAVRQSGVGQSSPTLFDDYSGFEFAGEAGALTVNDNWPTTVYDYAPQFAPTISVFTLESDASDETIVTTRTELASALNNATFNRIYCQKGDLTDGADDDELTLTISGSLGNERQFLYYDPGNPSQDIRLLSPWNQVQGDRANMPRIVGDTANFTQFVGLSWGIIGSQTMRCWLADGTSSNNLHYRCNMENGKAHVWTNRNSGCDDNIAFECVNHDHIFGTGDIHCYNTLNGDSNRVVSGEGWDYLGDYYHIEGGGSNNCVLEDNDIYRLTHYDGNGNVDVNGNYGGGEGGFDGKNMNPDFTSTCKIYGNRISGMRLVDPIIHPAGGTGAPIAFSNDPPTLFEHFGMDARWNVLFDSTDGAIICNSYRDGTGPNDGNHSVVRNIIYDIRSQNANRPVLYMNNDKFEVYLNSIHNTQGGSNLNLLFNFRNDATKINHDLLGNSFQDTGAFFNQAFWDTPFTIGYNAYSGTFTEAEKNFTSSNYLAPSKAALNMGDMTLRVRKLTIPDNPTIENGGLVVIPGVVPTSSTPSEFRTLTPTSGGDQIGNKTDQGVDDVF
ncbi:MAG: hypothetical protein V3V89_02645 [Gammaproteobacteria bacterium]